MRGKTKKIKIEKEVRESPYFLNSKGEVEFNKECLDCDFSCKQSHKATIVYCHKFSKKKKK